MTGSSSGPAGSQGVQRAAEAEITCFSHRCQKILSKTAIRGVILWLSKAVTHTCPVGEFLVSPREKVTLGGGLSDALGAVAGGRRGRAQGNVALVLFEALGGISSGTEL